MSLESSNSFKKRCYPKANKLTTSKSSPPPPPLLPPNHNKFKVRVLLLLIFFNKKPQNSHQFLVPCGDLRLKRANEGGPLHRHCLDDVVLQQHLDVLEGGQDAQPCVLVGREVEVHIRPVILHLHQRLTDRQIHVDPSDRQTC